jgi:hypothetical protein
VDEGGSSQKKAQKVRLLKGKFATNFRVVSDVGFHVGCIVYELMHVSLSEFANCLLHEVMEYGT